jgi:hypothetical protein
MAAERKEESLMPNAFYGWRQRIAVAVASAAFLSGAALTDAQQKAPEPTLEKFTASIVDTVTRDPSEAERGDLIYVVIERWSTEEERQALVRAFEEKGAGGLLSALRKTEPVGKLRKSLARTWDLYYAVQVPAADGGRRIIVGTDRPVDYWEVNREEKASYPFTLIELRLDKEDKGDGRIAPATKISRSKDGKHFELEHYAAEPMRLKDVHKQKD